MDNLESVRRTRTAERGWVSRAAKEIDNVCSQDGVTVIEMEVVLSNFDARLQKLDDIQAAIEQLVDIKDIEQEVMSAADYRESIKAGRQPCWRWTLLEILGLRLMLHCLPTLSRMGYPEMILILMGRTYNLL